MPPSQSFVYREKPFVGAFLGLCLLVLSGCWHFSFQEWNILVKKKTQGPHSYVVPWVLWSLANLPSYHLLEYIYFIYNAHRFCLYLNREKYFCSILSEMKSSLWFHWVCFIFLFSISLISALIFIFYLFFFSNLLWCKVKLFSNIAYSTINFFLNYCFNFFPHILVSFVFIFIYLKILSIFLFWFFFFDSLVTLEAYLDSKYLEFLHWLLN